MAREITHFCQINFTALFDIPTMDTKILSVENITKKKEIYNMIKGALSISNILFKDTSNNIIFMA